MDLCVACSVFLFDWMCHPLSSTDYFTGHVRLAYFEKAIPTLLPEIHRLMSKMNELLKYMFEAKIKSVLQMRRAQLGIYGQMYMNDTRPKELIELEWITTVQLFREYVSHEDVDFLILLIDESYILDSSTTSELWLGMILSTLMKELPPIHTGHTKASESAAAVAMDGFICPREHAIARELFDSAEDDLYI